MSAAKGKHGMDLFSATGDDEMTNANKRTMACELVFVTAEMAKAWLDDPRRHRNRPIDTRAVSKLVGVLRRGEADKPGDVRADNMIKFDSNGCMLDGQHRCTAIWATSIGMWCWIARDQPTEHIARYDQARNRAIWDNIYVLHGEEDVKPKHEIIRSMVNIVSRSVRNLTVSESQMFTWLNDHRAGIDYALSVKKRRKASDEVLGLRVAGILGSVALVHPMEPARIERFVDSYLSGSGLSRGDPELTLRTQVLNNRKRLGWMAARDTGRIAIRAMIAAIRNERLQILKEQESAMEYVLLWHSKRLGRDLEP
jgi:hypothetical protein